jgi:hypothetical protein
MFMKYLFVDRMVAHIGNYSQHYVNWYVKGYKFKDLMSHNMDLIIITNNCTSVDAKSGWFNGWFLITGRRILLKSTMVSRYELCKQFTFLCGQSQI